MMGLFKRNRFIFEFKKLDNIELDPVESTSDMINCIILENQRLKDLNQSGSVLVIKRNQKNKIIFAKMLTLPIVAGVDIDQLLSDFYSKRPVSYDESILSEPVETVSNTQQKINEDQEAGYAPIPEFLNSEGELEVESDPVVVETAELNQKDTSIVVSEPLEQKSTSDEAVDSSLEQLSETAPISEAEANVEPQKDAPHDEVELRDGDSKLVSDYLATDYSQEVHSSDSDVNALLETVKKELEQTMLQFVAQEKAKIDDEIKLLDKRDNITAEVTQSYTAEEQNALDNNSKSLLFERDQAAEKERIRHQQALDEIEINYQSQLSQSTEAIKQKYASMIQVKITEEYTRQTTQLEQILQGKTAELLIRQKTLNAGLKQNFAASLQSFNSQHDQMIENVEKSKALKPPIDFKSRAKQLRA